MVDSPIQHVNVLDTPILQVQHSDMELVQPCGDRIWRPGRRIPHTLVDDMRVQRLLRRAGLLA